MRFADRRWLLRWKLNRHLPDMVFIPWLVVVRWACAWLLPQGWGVPLMMGPGRAYRLWISAVGNLYIVVRVLGRKLGLHL